MVLNPTKLKETNHSDLLFWEYKVSEWNLPSLWREDTCTWQRQQAGAKFLSSGFFIIKVHMALQRLCLIQNTNLLKAMNYLLGQVVSKEWLLPQQSVAGASAILLLWADVQYDAKSKSFCTLTVHQLKADFLSSSMWIFFSQNQTITKTKP